LKVFKVWLAVARCGGWRSRNYMITNELHGRGHQAGGHPQPPDFQRLTRTMSWRPVIPWASTSYVATAKNNKLNGWQHLTVWLSVLYAAISTRLLVLQN